MSENEVTKLDTRGLRCPLPLLKLRQALRHLPQGAQLLLLADDAGSATDIPHWLATSEHQLLQQQQDAGELRFLIRC